MYDYSWCFLHIVLRDRSFHVIFRLFSLAWNADLPRLRSACDWSAPRSLAGPHSWALSRVRPWNASSGSQRNLAPIDKLNHLLLFIKTGLFCLIDISCSDYCIRVENERAYRKQWFFENESPGLVLSEREETCFKTELWMKKNFKGFSCLNRCYHILEIFFLDWETIRFSVNL